MLMVVPDVDLYIGYMARQACFAVTPWMGVARTPLCMV